MRLPRALAKEASLSQAGKCLAEAKGMLREQQFLGNKVTFCYTLPLVCLARIPIPSTQILPATTGLALPVGSSAVAAQRR